VFSQLLNRETGKAYARQQQRSQTATEAVANSKIEKQHGLFFTDEAPG
jgi:hypothetical protein